MLWPAQGSHPHEGIGEQQEKQLYYMCLMSSENLTVIDAEWGHSN